MFKDLSKKKKKAEFYYLIQLKKKQEQAVVIAVGTGKNDKDGNPIEMPVTVGDIILMEKYSGQEVKLEDDEFIIIKADDIIAIVNK